MKHQYSGGILYTVVLTINGNLRVAKNGITLTECKWNVNGMLGKYFMSILPMFHNITNIGEDIADRKNKWSNITFLINYRS